MADTSALEEELKLELSPYDADLLADLLTDLLADCGLAGGAPRLVSQESTYFDTPDHALARAGLSLRVRRSGRRHKQTIKADGSAAGMLVRSEWEREIAGNQPVLDVDEETFDRVMRVNVKSIYLFAREVVPVMRDAGGGVILNIGSTAGLRPRPGLSWYNATKGAVNVMSKSLALDFAPWKIRVNAICPVMGATGLLTEFMGVPDTPENRAKFVSTIPLGRMSRAEDIANAALYLASDEAEFITGVELPVDGGRTV